MHFCCCCLLHSDVFQSQDEALFYNLLAHASYLSFLALLLPVAISALLGAISQGAEE